MSLLKMNGTTYTVYLYDLHDYYNFYDFYDFGEMGDIIQLTIGLTRNTFWIPGGIYSGVNVEWRGQGVEGGFLQSQIKS